MLLSDVMLYIIMFTKLKFSLEKWHKGKFDVVQNGVQWDIAFGEGLYIYIVTLPCVQQTCRVPSPPMKARHRH